MDQLVNDIRSSAQVPIGEVRIGILPSAAHPLFTTVYERARERYPRISLSVREGQGAELDTLILSGAVPGVADTVATGNVAMSDHTPLRVFGPSLLELPELSAPH